MTDTQPGPHRPAVIELTALSLIALMVSFPFLNTHHRNPLPAFFSEWWAAFFGLLAAFVLLGKRYRAHIVLPSAALIPATLVALILLQLGLLPVARADASMLAVLYLLWAILLMGVASCLIKEHGAKRLSNAVAIGIAVGALASVLVLVFQGTGALSGTGLVSPTAGNRLFANLNQPNHLALQLWLGVVAVIRLADQRLLNTRIAVAAIVTLVLASLFTGSRAALLYASVLPLFALWQHRKIGTARTMLPLSIVALLAALAGQFALPLLIEIDAFATVREREWRGNEGDNIRTGLWWMAVQMGSDNLITGIGWGRFSSQSFAQIIALRDAVPDAMPVIPAEHAHNIGLNLFAELGLAGPVLFFCLVTAWGVRVWHVSRTCWSGEMAFGVGLLLLLGLHAQVEYTLWYTFFLGIAAIALALTDTGRLSLPRLSFPVTALILVASLTTLLHLRNDYETLENTVRWPLTADGKPPRPWEDVKADLLELRGRSNFGAYLDLSLAGSMSFERQGLADKLVICNNAIAFLPANYVVFKCAALLALDGQASAAHDLMRRALIAYPEKAEEFVHFGGRLVNEMPELEPLVVEAQGVVKRVETMGASH